METKNWMLDVITKLIENKSQLSDKELAKKLTICQIEHTRLSILQIFGKSGSLDNSDLRSEAIKLDYDLKWKIKELGEEPHKIVY